MKLFKLSAFLISIASLLSFKSNAYIIQLADNTQFVTVEPIAQPQNQEFLFAENRVITINEANLNPGQYRLKNDQENEFGFLYVNDRLPNRILQIQMAQNGHVIILFNGNTAHLRAEARSDENIIPLNINNNQIEFQNAAPDTEIIIYTVQGRLIIRLFPNIEIEAPIDEVVQAPIEWIIADQERLLPPDFHVFTYLHRNTDLNRFAQTLKWYSDRMKFATSHYLKHGKGENRQYKELIIKQNHKAIIQADQPEKFSAQYWQYQEECKRQKAFLEHIRPKYAPLKFNDINLDAQHSLAQTENAVTFGKRLHCLKYKPYASLDSLDVYYLLNNIIKNDLEFIKIDLECRELSVQSIYDHMYQTIEMILEDVACDFPENLEHIITERTIKFVESAYKPFIAFAELRLFPYLEKIKNSEKFDATDINSAQQLLAEYDALLENNNDFFGRDGHYCFQKIASDLFIGNARKLINVDFNFLKEVSRNINLALRGEGGWDIERESVMNVALVAQRFHIDITQFIEQSTNQFDDPIEMFISDADVLRWLESDSIEIKTAFENSKLRNQHQHFALVATMTDYEYMLWVASQARFCCAKLDQYGLNESAIAVKGILLAYLMEQNRQCGKGMVGRMFIVLNSILAEFGQLINKINHTEVQLLIRK